MIHRGIDGALVNLEREPLRKHTLARIAEVKAATGWVPVGVSDWCVCFVCAKCQAIYARTYLDRGGYRQWRRACPTCGSEGHRPDEYRTIRYWSLWRPWTWARPSLYECRSWTDVVEVEALPEPANGSAAGRVTLSEDT